MWSSMSASRFTQPCWGVSLFLIAAHLVLNFHSSITYLILFKVHKCVLAYANVHICILRKGTRKLVFVLMFWFIQLCKRFINSLALHMPKYVKCPALVRFSAWAPRSNASHASSNNVTTRITTITWVFVPLGLFYIFPSLCDLVMFVLFLHFFQSHLFLFSVLVSFLFRLRWVIVISCNFCWIIKNALFLAFFLIK